MYNCVVDCCGVSTKKGSTLPDHSRHWPLVEAGWNTGRGMLSGHTLVYRLGCHQHIYLDLSSKRTTGSSRQTGQDVMIHYSHQGHVKTSWCITVTRVMPRRHDTLNSHQGHAKRRHDPLNSHQGHAKRRHEPLNSHQGHAKTSGSSKQTSGQLQNNNQNQIKIRGTDEFVDN